MGGVNYDKRSADRIDKVVQYIERSIQGSTYSLPRRTPQILPDFRVVGFTLTEDMGETTAGEASCTVHKVWDPATETYAGTDSGVVVDPGGVFASALDKMVGKGIVRKGDSRNVVDPLTGVAPRYYPIRYRLYGMRRESDSTLKIPPTIETDDNGTWEIAPAWDGNEAASKTTRLATTAFDDPCLELNESGFWKLTLQHYVSAEAIPADASEYTETATGETDSHVHTYDKFSLPSMWQIISNLQAQNGGVGGWASKALAASTLTRWHDDTYNFDVTNTTTYLKNLDVDTLVRIRSYKQSSNVAATGGFLLAGSSLICEYLGAYQQEE